MTIKLRSVKPQEIEAESFRLIEEELGAHGLDPQTFAVVRRVIHATGDFSFAETLCFHSGAIGAGLAAIRAGKDVLVDVNMGAVGVNRGLLSQWGGKVVCGLSDPSVAELARTGGLTRSEAAMIRFLRQGLGLVAIGNAPTALLKLMELVDRRPELQPGLVIGVPVGFVNAAESKELLALQPYPFITCRGRKGGSPVAAAIVNALLHLAREQ